LSKKAHASTVRSTRHTKLALLSAHALASFGRTDEQSSPMMYIVINFQPYVTSHRYQIYEELEVSGQTCPSDSSIQSAKLCRRHEQLPLDNAWCEWSTSRLQRIELRLRVVAAPAARINPGCSVRKKFLRRDVRKRLRGKKRLSRAPTKPPIGCLQPRSLSAVVITALHENFLHTWEH